MDGVLGAFQRLRELSPPEEVLILIVMDGVLGESGWNRRNTILRVLILIVMDGVLGALRRSVNG